MAQVQFGGPENPQRLLGRLARINSALEQPNLSADKRAQLQQAKADYVGKIAALRDELSAAIAE